ncbi:hypothetical protein, partial [Mesorhizobium sp. M0113]|uniref:hypothetical protein n=1 Tax=Mesorhizobium sp. M0113 TaxID=2956881 RepID=UPI00333C7FCC
DILYCRDRSVALREPADRDTFTLHYDLRFYQFSTIKPVACKVPRSRSGRPRSFSSALGVTNVGSRGVVLRLNAVLSFSPVARYP